MPRRYGNPKRICTGLRYRNWPVSQMPMSHLRWLNMWYRDMQPNEPGKAVFRYEYETALEEIRRRQAFDAPCLASRGLVVKSQRKEF